MELLAAITPNDVLRCMNLKTFGTTELAGDACKPNFGTCKHVGDGQKSNFFFNAALKETLPVVCW